MWPPDCWACLFMMLWVCYFSQLSLVWLKSIICGQMFTAEMALVVKTLLSPSNLLPLSTIGLYEQHGEMFASSDIGRAKLAQGMLQLTS